MKVNEKAMFVYNRHTFLLSLERQGERERENRQRYDKHTYTIAKLITIGRVHAHIHLSPFGRDIQGCFGHDNHLPRRKTWPFIVGELVQ